MIKYNKILICKGSFFFCLVFILLLTGCSTIINSRKQKEQIINHYKSGDHTSSSLLLNDYLDSRRGTGDELMWLLEVGSLMFELKNYEGSLQALNEAENIVNDYDSRAVVSLRHVGAEGYSLLTNPNAIPYYGYFYDRILLNTYKALNYFAMSDPDAAMVELRRAYEKQKDAKKYFEVELKKNIKIFDIDNKQKYFVPGVSSVLNRSDIKKEYRRMLEHSENDRYGSFINPFTTYLLAIGYLTEGDYDEAYIDLNELYKISPDNIQIQRDIVTCAVKAGRKIPHELSHVKPLNYSLDKNVIYIIYACGLAPALKENKIQLILPKVGYTGFAYPSIEYSEYEMPIVKVSDSGGKVFDVYKIADMDNIISQEFKEYFYSRVSRIAASVLTKESATIAALHAVEDEENSGFIKLSILLAASIYKAAFNTADTRSWQLLPNEFYITNMPMPEDGIINITDENNIVHEQLKIDRKKGDKAIVFVRAPNKNNINIILCQFF